MLWGERKASKMNDRKDRGAGLHHGPGSSVLLGRGTDWLMDRPTCCSGGEVHQGLRKAFLLVTSQLCKEPGDGACTLSTTRNWNMDCTYATGQGVEYGTYTYTMGREQTMGHIP